ncbi:MAG: hypothetical protein ABJP70_04785 [Erythrobacter sp.]
MNPPPRVTPTAAWDGTEASGFAAIPSDPVRSTAKPACRLITPPRQWFSDNILVGVQAWANNQGSLLNCGLEKVIFHFEGASTEVTAPSFESFADANGKIVTYFGWWVNLTAPANGQTGFGNLYVEAVPADTSVQSRVIGPYLYAPQDQAHDIELEVAASQPEIAGQRYQNPGLALAYLQSQSPVNPRIQITEAGLYEMLETGGANNLDMPGRVLIEATVPGVSIGRTGYTDDANAWIQNNGFPLHFRGSNLTIDLQHVRRLNGDLGAYDDGIHWLDGCNLTSTSPQGRFEHFRGGVIDLSGQRVVGLPWFTEVNISGIAASLGKVSLARGCVVDDISYDIASDSICCVHNTITNHDDTFWLLDHEALSVTYTGAEATATFERDGSVDTNGGMFTAKWGANTATFEYGQSEDYFLGNLGDGYSIQDLVDWVNTLTDWTAVLTPPSNQTYYTSLADQRAGQVSTAGEAGKSFAAENVKDTVLQLWYAHDRHSDFYQHSVGIQENIIMAFNRVQAMMQSIFVGPVPRNSPAEDPIANDMVFVGNVFDVNGTPLTFYDPSVQASQIGKTDVETSHIVMAHNTWINQGLRIRSDSSGFDMLGYGLIANNVLRSLDFNGAEDADATITNNHLYGTSPGPILSTGTSNGGALANLFVDEPGDNFTPAGELLTNGSAPVAPFDVDGNAFPTPFAARGAIAAAATEFVDPGNGSGSMTPESDLLALLNTAGAGSYFDCRNAAAYPIPDVTNNAGSFNQTNANFQPAFSADGLVYDANNDRVQFDRGTEDNWAVIIGMTHNNGDTSGVIISGSTSNAVFVQYLDGNVSGHSGLVRVNGATAGNRGQLFTLLNGAGLVAVELEGADFSGHTHIQIGRGSSTGDMTVRKVAFLPVATLGANFSQALLLARDAVVS